MNKTYKTVKIEGIGYYEEKKSKFTGFIRHTETEEEAAAFLSEIRKKYYDASHHCYACVLGKDGGNVRSRMTGNLPEQRDIPSWLSCRERASRTAA